MTSHVLEGFGKYPYRRPRVFSLSHQSRRSVIFPTAAASSAYHICLQCPSSSLISGIVARAYMAMASGSPCVVPSCDRMVSPLTTRSVGALYVLIRMVERGGQILLMLWRATCLLRELKALLASTSSTASFSSKAKADLTVCLDPRYLPSTQLDAPRGSLDVWTYGEKSSLGNDTPGCVSYADRTNAGVFVQGD